MVSSLAMATPTPCALPSATYNTYNPQALGTLTGSVTCTINNLTFSEFQFASSSTGGATLPVPSDITVTPQTTLGNEGFIFSENFVNQDATLSFLVTAAPGTTISDLSIFLNSASNGGSANFTETYCTAAFTGPSCQTFAAGDLFGTFSKEIDIAPVPKLYITKDFGVTGNATFSTVGNNYSNVPEPSQLGMLLVGMGGLFFARRKANASAQ